MSVNRQKHDTDMANNTQHYIAFSGIEVKHSLIGSEKSTERFSGLTVEGDFNYERLRDGHTDLHFGGSNSPIVSNGDYTLHLTHFTNITWHDMTAEERAEYDKVLENANLCFKTIKIINITPIKHRAYTTESTFLCWKDTDKMPIIVNGKATTAKEFLKTQLPNNAKVVHAYDNGYSNWGEETRGTDTIVRVVKEICSEHTGKPDTWRGGRVHCGEICGISFDRHGAMIVRLTDKDINWSIVSNT